MKGTKHKGDRMEPHRVLQSLIQGVVNNCVNKLLPVERILEGYTDEVCTKDREAASVRQYWRGYRNGLKHCVADLRSLKKKTP